MHLGIFVVISWTYRLGIRSCRSTEVSATLFFIQKGEALIFQFLHQFINFGNSRISILSILSCQRILHFYFCSTDRIAQHPVQMSVQGAVRLFSPVSYGIGAILSLEVFQQEAFFIFTVFADTPSADKVFISFNLENRPPATVVVSCVEAVAHILPQTLEQPLFLHSPYLCRECRR